MDPKVYSKLARLLLKVASQDWKEQVFSDDTGEYRIGDILDYIKESNLPLTAFPVESLTDINLAKSADEAGDQVPGSPEFVARAQRSDLSHPIIVIEYPDGRFIADGVHRLWKAYDSGRSKINGFLLTSEELSSKVKRK